MTLKKATLVGLKSTSGPVMTLMHVWAQVKACWLGSPGCFCFGVCLNRWMATTAQFFITARQWNLTMLVLPAFSFRAITTSWHLIDGLSHDCFVFNWQNLHINILMCSSIIYRQVSALKKVIIWSTNTFKWTFFPHFMFLRSSPDPTDVLSAALQPSSVWTGHNRCGETLHCDERTLINTPRWMPLFLAEMSGQCGNAFYDPSGWRWMGNSRERCAASVFIRHCQIEV